MFQPSCAGPAGSAGLAKRLGGGFHDDFAMLLFVETQSDWAKDPRFRPLPLRYQQLSQLHLAFVILLFDERWAHCSIFLPICVIST